jgi:hypothetical protein
VNRPRGTRDAAVKADSRWNHDQSVLIAIVQMRWGALMTQHGPSLPFCIATPSAKPKTDALGANGAATAAPAAIAEPELIGFRNFIRTPCPGERFAIDGKDPRQNLDASADLLGRLAKCMRSDTSRLWQAALPGAAEVWENPDIPAGYTYFTQLAMHDLVHTTDAPALDPKNPSSVQNHRHSRFTLDTIYGAGPIVCRHAYERWTPGEGRTRLRLGPISAGGPQGMRDIGRAEAMPGKEGVYRDPLIADPRNDNSTILAQLTAVFHLLHNVVMDQLEQAMPPHPNERVREKHRLFAREIVGTVFRACVRYDLLPRILHPQILRRYTVAKPFFMDSGFGLPLEFSHAAARFGHAMVRPSYFLNGAPKDKPLEEMLWQTSDFRPVRFPLSDDFVIQWQRFFNLTPVNSTARLQPNYSRRIGPEVVTFKTVADAGAGGIAERDLVRGITVGLWSVQALRREIENRVPGTTGLSPMLANPDCARQQICKLLSGLAAGSSHLTPDEISLLSKDPPLGLFVLFEAYASPNDGKHLGVLGSVIVAEVMFGALIAAGARSIATIAGQIYGAEGPAVFAAVAEDASKIQTLPDVINFVAQNANLQQAAPPFI